ncbi:alkyl hydroperoxide reductase/ Thiol specific antioxidant/ Mal allergen [Desulforamulus reducens MI-1]|uniref:Alkyl hydroperoxide reductase/ Thiol specific antioxidant/ Mal allergen n=1 Tax=Desulforamulus reducens (strain ATCC BAA-1160 / DSM 100696 / MI-1) TaxID=349161 RepID=A4J4Q9_DESRM|nr:TlpA disulfide reductase family protein [Desulforamulus reducens]ABO50062.1 alkyl hydroperoxide reductase/ Thiol specific antioxidant/ Mal allergen [Desulforamulus reducens MI-1]
MKKNILFLVIIIAIAAGVFIYRNYQEDELVGQVSQSDSVTTGQTEQKELTKEDKTMAPDFKLKDLSGKEFSLADFREKIVLINFWTTWCPYCIVEMPEIEKTYQKYKDKGFVVLAVNLTDQEKNPQDPVKFIAEKGYSFPVLLDEKGEVSLQYAIRSLPTSFIIGPEGEITEAKIGPFAPMELETKIKGLLKE